MTKKRYTKPKLLEIILDNEISLIMMTYTDPDDPPPPPPGAASMQANPFEQNSFNNNSDKSR